MHIESLSFQNVLFEYGPGQKVFDQLTFDLPMGKNILVTGPPGNGQSTFLKLIAVMVQPQMGRYLINNQNTTEMSFEEFQPIRRKIGYTFDYGGLFANRMLFDNLSLPLMYHKICSQEEVRERIQHLGEEFNFAKQLNRRPAEVSGGLRKLVCVLRSFILGPELVVMDDPFTGVDTESAKKLINLIQAKRETGELKHVFFTSRDEVWAKRLGNGLLIIESGQPRFESLNERAA